MPAKNGWIDFRELCKSVEFSKVLELYNVELKVRGERATGFCPLPSHQGKRHSPSFSANLARGIWQCFGCSAKGNILDFTARMEGLDLFKGKDVRKAALLLQEKLGLKESPLAIGNNRHSKPEVLPPLPKNKLPVIVNAPLDFELKNLDAEHPYLLNRGFTPVTIQEFGLGYCNKGMLKERIAIPIHDPAGMLVGYAGRVVDDRAISENNPKYKLPAARAKWETL